MIYQEDDQLPGISCQCGWVISPGRGWHHMMLTALIHSSSLRELTEISSSFFSKPLFMKKRGGGLRGSSVVGPNGYDQILCTCICIMHPDVHDNVNSLKVNNLIEYMYFSEIAVIMFSRIGEFSQLLVWCKF